MPNWVYNSLEIEAIEADPKQLTDLVNQLNTPFVRQHEQWDMETNQMVFKDYTYSNPIFAFWNIIKPTDMETYKLQKDPAVPDMTFMGNNWYDWNVRNWGTKWDVAMSDDEQYKETSVDMTDADSVTYSFNTAWSPATEAILNLSSQYPELVFTLTYQEETGWGGDCLIMDGKFVNQMSYDSMCRDCDAIDSMEYCESDCGEICSECNYMGEADLDAVAKCDTHKEYLDSEHVPEYRLDKIQSK